MVKDILKKHGVYSLDLENDLLRHFDNLRQAILRLVPAKQQGIQERVEYIGGWKISEVSDHILFESGDGAVFKIDRPTANTGN